MRYLFGDYALDISRCELRRTGRRIQLRPKVFDVLSYLITHRDRVVSQQDLLERLWPQQFVGEATLKSCIKEARRAVGDTGKTQRLIQTLHRRGYRFVAAVEEASASPVEEVAHACLDLPLVSAPDDLWPVMAHSPIQERAAYAWVKSEGASFDAPNGERKPVTILCCALADARGLTAHLGHEAVYLLMRAFLALAQRLVQHYAGTLTQRLSDGFVAIFGAPIAHEDHARRAVLAALAVQQHTREEPALREPLRGASLSTSMGLHTGVVIVGPLEEEPQMLYVALDDAADIAGQLQHMAGPDTILMSEATRRLVQEEVQVEAYDAPAMVELPERLPVFKVRAVMVRRSGVAGRGGRLLSPFVGRTRELPALQALLDQVEVGQGQVVGIVGEPGIGKSRLLYEFARTLCDTQVSYLEGHCLAYDQATPYGPVLGILRQLCGISDVDGPEAMTAKLRHCLREAGLSPETDALYLLPLLGVPEGAVPLADLSPEARKARTLALLRHLSLHSQEGRPRVIAVENVHWSDPSSEEYLARVADGLSGAQLLLITTYRPGYAPPWLDRSCATQLALSPLRPQDSHAVVRSVLSSTTHSSPWEHAIVGTAGGNPFFLEELAWAVREGGMAQPTVLIPDTVQAVLAARIDRLPPVEKRLLQTAAVIGHEVPLRLLQAIAELPEDALQRGLAHLQAGEFLYETRLAPDLAYMFKHALTHEVAYNSLLQERRRSLHTRIVEALETLAGKRAADQVERLAHHAWQGELWAKAVVYLRQAGTKAIAGSANREASAHFERALVALAHLPQSRTLLEEAIDVRCELRMALVPLNELGRICDILHEAEALARALDDQRRLGKVSILITHYLWSIWDLDRALTSGHRALDLVITLRDISLQGMAYFVLGEVYYGLGDYQQAVAMLRRNVAALDQVGSQGRFGEPALGPGLQAVGSLRWLIHAMTNVGAFAEGLTLAEDALRLAEADGHPYTLVLAYTGVGYLYLGKGEIPKAIALLEQGLELCRIWDIELTSARLDGALGYALALSGRIPEALALLERAVGQLPCASVTSRIVLNTLWVSEVYLRAEHLLEASTLAMQALALAREHKERGTEAWTLRLLADIAMHRDSPEVQQVEIHYLRALALADELGMRPLQAHCHLGLGTLYAKTAQREQARAELIAAIALYRTMDMTFWLPQAEAALA